jgi:signal transduction histidine kinase
MNLNSYQVKIIWKFVLLLIAGIISAYSLWYTNKIVSELADLERTKMTIWANATKAVASGASDESDLTFYLEVISANTTIPVILTDESGNVMSSRNIESEIVSDTVKFSKLKKRMASENDPIEVDFLKDEKLVIYYSNSLILTKLKIYPFFQLLIIGLFLLVSYFAFNYSRKSEQDKVWSGMSKETAHQLGTPLSSIAAWLDIMKSDKSIISDDMLREMEIDVNRLELITERFSKIGSDPVLKEMDLIKVLKTSIDYIEKRVSKKVIFHFFNQIKKDQVFVKINEPLLAWVIENLTKNAIDAMKGEGHLTFSIEDSDTNYYFIDITDTGSGISSRNFKTVFKPGFTSKKRGWGLGLSLAKRIIEYYHKGQIFVKKSEIGKGTTFRICLKK